MPFGEMGSARLKLWSGSVEWGWLDWVVSMHFSHSVVVVASEYGGGQERGILWQRRRG